MKILKGNQHLLGALLLLPAAVHGQNSSLRGAFRLAETQSVLNDHVWLTEPQSVLNDHVWLAESQSVLDDHVWRNASLHRSLQEAPKFFQPLSCNDVACVRTTWTQLNPTNGIIPCGMCVTMNYDATDVLELPNGLDVRGTLLIPSGRRIFIKTPFVIVQGQLEMIATGRVTGEPWIKFLFTGTFDVNFVPQGENRFVCSPDGASTPTACNVGMKPFVVAGGKVRMKGIKGNSVTWAKLQDIVRGGLPSAEQRVVSLPSVRSINRSCQSWVLMNEDFETADNPHRWTGGYGAKYAVTGSNTFEVSNRRAGDQGPTWDMLWIRDCLIPGQTYLFSARVKLTKPNTAAGTKTSCALSNTNCLRLFSLVKTPTGQLGRRKGWWERGHDVRYGQWTDFHATFEYIAEELSELNIYQIFQLEGVEAGVDIEVDDLLFSLPDPKTLPDPSNVCGGDLVLNGAALASPVHPYPMSITVGLLSVEIENGRPYFHHSGRTSDHHSFVYEFPAPSCLVANGRYRVSASIRIDSATSVRSRLEMRTQFTNNRVVERTLVDCPNSDRSGWTTCSADITLQPELLADNIATMRLQFETFGGDTYDMDVTELTMQLLDGSVTSIVVPAAGIDDSWGSGAEILITSHTLSYEDGQVRTLMANPRPYGDGFVQLDLNETIVPPTTMQDSPDFAVEVALLSRNILFEGDTDHPDSLIGAHLIVMQTQRVAHMIDGVEFRNYGQQGLLGRYPIHFHLSGDASGGVVKRNSIRGSHQRCIVIHGTNGVLILDNIAYDTKGHCFMLEDGGEINNVFRKNLGALTKTATRPVGPFETDHLLPSTYWCSNPQNSWIENVAAGSKDNGFWFELGDSVRGLTASMPGSAEMNPRTMPLKAFRQNLSHSNGKHGIRTYPHGYLPTVEARFLNNLSYRNRGDGFFIHNSKNLFIQGGILADNSIQADFDMADDLRLEGTSIIGVSDSFQAIVDTQSGIDDHSDMVVGVELHAFSLFDEGGAKISSVSFSGFDGVDSNHVALIELDEDLRTPHFDYFSSISGISVQGNVDPNQFDFRKALGAGVDDAYIVDLNSSMKPSGSSASGVSTVVSDTNLMKTFLDQNKCESVSSRGYMYCSNTCIRTIVYSVDSAMTENYRLRVSNDKGQSVDLVGHYYEDPRNDMRNDWLRRDRLFSASLPPGSYTAFFHTGNGQKAWPSHAEVSLKDTACANSLGVDDIQLDIPEPLDSECQDLIRNGDVEDSSSHPNYWLQHEGGLKVLNTGGRNGSRGVADVSQSTKTGALGQYVDTRCLKRGRQYAVQADVKLTRNGIVTSCDKVANCPKARVRIETATDPEGSSFEDVTFDVANSFIRPYRENAWNTLHGVFTIESRMAAGASMSIYIERQLTGTMMTLDNVSLRMIPKDCSELVFNGDFGDGTSRFWETSAVSNSLQLAMRQIQGKWALDMSGRSSHAHSPMQEIQNGCMKAGKRYLASARVRLSNADGSVATCDPSYLTGSKACPRMRIRSFVDWRLPSQEVYTPDGGSIAAADHFKTSDGWLFMSGAFTATDGDERADKIELFWDQVSSHKIFTIQDVSIVPLEENCNQLILNGDASYGETASFWRIWNVGGGGKISSFNDNGRKVIKTIDRFNNGDGPYQFIDPSCLRASGSKWRLTALMKLESNGQGVACLPASTSAAQGCPPIRVMGWVGNQKVFDQMHRMLNRPTWSPNGYNSYQVEFTVSEALANMERVAISIRDFNKEWDLLMDNVSLAPV